MGGREPVIAIDGPAGAGKSTAARRLAERLGYALVPTGAMYRAVALSVLRAGLPPEDGPALRRLLAGITVEVRDGRVYLDGEDVSEAIRGQEVGQLTSVLTTLAAVRERLTPIQRRAAAVGGVVLEGRDTGTVVCPDAEVKFFLTASLDSRTRRRHAELAARGIELSPEAIRAEIAERDVQDSTRALAPLRRAERAIDLDTTDLSIDEVVDRMVRAVEERRCSTPS